MAVIDEILRLEGAAGVIKEKTVALGLDKDSQDGSGKVTVADKLDVHARAIDDIQNQSAVNQTLDASTTSVSIPKGYYGSDSTVNVSTMSAPEVILSNAQQIITCDDKMMDGNITIPAAHVYRTGSTEPTSSTPGNNGDLYLVI